jgi:hypothetical protein
MVMSCVCRVTLQMRWRGIWLSTRLQPLSASPLTGQLGQAMSFCRKLMCVEWILRVFMVPRNTDRMKEVHTCAFDIVAPTGSAADVADAEVIRLALCLPAAHLGVCRSSK